MNNILKRIANFIIAPLVVLKRYKDATNEIVKVRQVDSKLGKKHIENARLLEDRIGLLSTLSKGGVVAEVGVASGDFSEQILNICQPKTLHLVDYWEKNKKAHGVSPAEFVKIFLGKIEQGWDIVNKKFHGEIASGRVVLHRGYSWDMLKTLPDHSLDWVYIDAAHDYSSVARDLEVTRQKVKSDGIIAGHDYVRWGSFGFRCGVVEAVNEFCIKYDYELLYLTIESNNNASFAIRKFFGSSY